MKFDLLATANGACVDAVVATDRGGETPFVAGPENRLGQAVVERLLQPGEHGYSPVVLVGPSGTGKTHLALDVARGRDSVVCTRAAEFARELANALEGDTIGPWRDRNRTAELFVFENLTEIVGRGAAQQELLHTLDALEARGATVIVTSLEPPGTIAKLSNGLRNRLAGGLVVSLAPPGLEARVMILGRLAEARGMTLLPEAARLLAEALAVTAADLQGVVCELAAMEAAGVRGQGSGVNESSRIVVGLEGAREYLAARRAQAKPTLRQVASAVARHYGLKQADLCGASRRRSVAVARSVAMYLGRQLIGSSLKELGRHFGGRDHTAALYSCRLVERRLAADGELRRAVASLRRELERV